MTETAKKAEERTTGNVAGGVDMTVRKARCLAKAVAGLVIACAVCVGGGIAGGASGGAADGVFSDMIVASAYADDTTSCTTVTTPEQALACAQQAADAANAAVKSAQQRLDQAKTALAQAAQDLANDQSVNERAQQVLSDLKDAKAALDAAANSDQAKQAIAKAKSDLSDATSAITGLDPDSFDPAVVKAAVDTALAQAQTVAQQAAQRLQDAQSAQQHRMHSIVRRPTSMRRRPARMPPTRLSIRPRMHWRKRGRRSIRPLRRPALLLARQLPRRPSRAASPHCVRLPRNPRHRAPRRAARILPARHPPTMSTTATPPLPA